VVSASGAWSTAMGRLAAAGDDLEAAEATADLIDAAVPGGAVVADDGADLVRAIMRIDRIDAFPFRAYLLSVLIVMSRWIWTWRRLLAAGDNRESTSAHAEREEATAREIEVACEALSRLVDDVDPQVRGMMFRLIGAAAPVDDRVLTKLRNHAENDADPLARGCAAAAVLCVLLRSSDTDRHVWRQWFSRYMSARPGVESERLHAEALSVSWRDDQRATSEMLIGMPKAGSVQLWPAEAI
jgi:hypothetical protein